MGTPPRVERGRTSTCPTEGSLKKRSDRQFFKEKRGSVHPGGRKRIERIRLTRCMLTEGKGLRGPGNIHTNARIPRTYNYVIMLYSNVIHQGCIG